MNFESFGEGWRFSAVTNGKAAWILCDTRQGRELMEIGFARLNQTPERDAVNEKCRFHGKLDNTETAIESLNVYPFGGESAILRNMTLRGKLLEVRMDIKPGKGEVIRDLELEELFFPGEFTRIEMIKSVPAPGGSWQLEALDIKETVLYESCDPFAVLLLTSADNMQIELGSGGDWWRMQGAGDTFWGVKLSPDGVTVRRRVVAISADEVIERRPWRFNYYVAWGRKSSANLAADPGDVILTPDPAKAVNCECFQAPAVRKYLRKTVRQQQENSGNVHLNLPDVQSCDDAGHLERPGKKALRHWGLDELFALYSWGNRTLGEGRYLTVQLPENSIFRQLPSGRYLAQAPSEAAIREI